MLIALQYCTELIEISRVHWYVCIASDVIHRLMDDTANKHGVVIEQRSSVGEQPNERNEWKRRISFILQVKLRAKGYIAHTWQQQPHLYRKDPQCHCYLYCQYFHCVSGQENVRAMFAYTLRQVNWVLPQGNCIKSKFKMIWLCQEWCRCELRIYHYPSLPLSLSLARSFALYRLDNIWHLTKWLWCIPIMTRISAIFMPFNALSMCIERENSNDTQCASLFLWEFRPSIGMCTAPYWDDLHNLRVISNALYQVQRQQKLSDFVLVGHCINIYQFVYPFCALPIICVKRHTILRSRTCYIFLIELSRGIVSTFSYRSV